MPLNVGLWVGGAVGAIGLAVTAAAVPFVTPALRRVCIPYVPATPAQLANVRKALAQRAIPQAAPLVDLGSGDGRVVLECAANGIAGAGVELNSLLVLYSKWRAMRLGLRHQARFHRRDLFRTNLADYNTAVIFGAESLMDILVPKLAEMREGTQLIACRFPLPEDTPNWRLVFTTGEGHDTVWLYLRTTEDAETTKKTS